MLAGPSLPIFGSNVVLTALAEPDEPRVAEACSTKEAEQWLDTPWPYTAANAAAFVREWVPAGWRGEHDERSWAIRASLDGPLLGVIGLRAQSREVGFWLHPDARGHGYMRDAVRAAASHARDCLVWPELVWKCIDGNAPSMRVAEATGFIYTGTKQGDHRGEQVTHHVAVLPLASPGPEHPLPWPRSNKKTRS